jgi:hypothetical protein
MYYVCSNFGCIWSGAVEDMREDYAYPASTYYFDTLREAEDFEASLREMA